MYFIFLTLLFCPGHVINKSEKSSCCILDLGGLGGGGGGGGALMQHQQSPDSETGGGVGLRLLMRSGSSPRGSAEVKKQFFGSGEFFADPDPNQDF